MTERFYNHLKNFVEVSEKEFTEIQLYFNLKNFAKKDHLMHAGENCSANYFVLSGCLHLYFLDEKGIEKTVQFGIENWWVTDYLAFYHQKTTDFYLQAVEDSEVLIIDFQQQEALFEKFPAIEQYFRHIYQIAQGAATMRMKYIFQYSKEEIFFRFQELFPEFVQRVPQYMVATYLGLTPEYLSEIKRKKRS